MAEPPVTRASLLVRLRGPADREAWGQFVELYAPLLYGLARKRGLQDADAADVQPARSARAKRRPMLPAASLVVLPAAPLVVLLILLAFYWLGAPVILWFMTGNVVVWANDAGVVVSEPGSARNHLRHRGRIRNGGG
jgi:hypothetical protein